MSEPTPEQQAWPAESPAWPGGGFAAPSTASHGSPLPPPGHPTQPAYPPQPAYPSQAAYPPQDGNPPAPGPQTYSGTYPGPTYAGPGATTSSLPGSTVVLLGLSVVGIVTTGIIGIPSTIIAALAWRQNRADPVAARRRTTKGWIVLAVNFAVGILVLIPFYVWASDNA